MDFLGEFWHLHFLGDTWLRAKLSHNGPKALLLAETIWMPLLGKWLENGQAPASSVGKSLDNRGRSFLLLYIGRKSTWQLKIRTW